jgi:hypothetical protein
MKLVNTIFFTVVSSSCIAQAQFFPDLQKFKWTADVKVTNFNIGSIKKAWLLKYTLPLDSLEKEKDGWRSTYTKSIWTFTNDEVIIKNFSATHGVEPDSVTCKYVFDSNHMTLRLFNYAQDTTLSEFSVTMLSPGSPLSLTKRE